MARMLKAVVDCAALQHNLDVVRTLTGKKTIAMVKANGYGHGLVRAAESLKKADALGVACIEEAVILREAGIQNRIVLMEGFFNGDEELPEIDRLDLEIVVHQPEQIAALQNYTCQKPFRVWIKIDTGMHRLGFSPEIFSGVWEALAANSGVDIEGYLTHFARADERGTTETSQQIERFLAAVSDKSGAKSMANSAGILGWPNSHADWVRPGIMLYGVSPFPGHVGEQEGLQSVMELSSELIAIQSVKAGEAVGYSGLFVCPKDMKVGVVAVGYGDGYPRLAPTGTPLLINGKKVPLIGRVSMDMITVDLSAVPEAKIGDPVQLWGPDLPVEKIADAVGTSAYELLTGLINRVHFITKNLHSVPGSSPA